MKTPIILGCIILSSLVLASCTRTKTPVTSPSPATTQVPVKTVTPPSMTHTTASPIKGEEHHMGATSEEEFIVNMIPHHQEAIDNAKIIIAKSENTELKKIAQVIVSAQTSEIVQLK